MLSAIKKMIPVAIKQAAKDYALGWHTQLSFDASCLRPAESLDLPSIWSDQAAAAAFTNDHARISELLAPRNIGDGVNTGDRRAIHYLVSHLKPHSVLEIGTNIGASTVYFACALHHVGGNLTTADIVDVNAPDGPWRDAGLSATPAAIVSRLGLGQTVTFRTASAAEALQTSERFDLVFLDGDHSKLAVYREISAALRILNPNGLILLHDFYPGLKPRTPGGRMIEGPFVASERIMREQSGLNFLPLGELPWPTKEGGKITTLALVAAAK